MSALNQELYGPETFSKADSFLRGVKAFGYLAIYTAGAALEDLKGLVRHPIKTVKKIFPLTLKTESLSIKDYSGNALLDWVNPEIKAWQDDPKGTLSATPMDKTRKAWVLSGFFAAASIIIAVPFGIYQLSDVFTSSVTPATPAKNTPTPPLPPHHRVH